MFAVLVTFQPPMSLLTGFDSFVSFARMSGLAGFM